MATLAYITIENNGTVSVIRTSDNTIIGTINVGNVPRGVSCSPNGDFVYVTNTADRTVSKIRTSDNTVVATIPVGLGAVGIVVSPNGLRVYVANEGAGTVSVIDTVSNTVVATITVPGNPFGIGVTPNGLFVYVTNSSGPAGITKISTGSNTVVGTIITGSSTKGIVFTPNPAAPTVYAYVANSTLNAVNVINTSTDTIVATVSVALLPVGICISPDGAFVYVACQGNTVNVIRTSDNTMVALIALAVGDIPVGISITPDGAFVYVACSNSGLVKVIDTSSNLVVATINTFNQPFAFGNFITVASPTITISPTELPDGTTGTFYNQSLTGSGGTAPYTFSITAGSLPPGIELLPDGTLTGYPTMGGVYTFTITATDSNGFMGSQVYTITISLRRNGGGRNVSDIEMDECCENAIKAYLKNKNKAK